MTIIRDSAIALYIPVPNEHHLLIEDVINHPFVQFALVKNKITLLGKGFSAEFSGQQRQFILRLSFTCED